MSGRQPWLPAVKRCRGGCAYTGVLFMTQHHALSTPGPRARHIHTRRLHIGQLAGPSRSTRSSPTRRPPRVALGGRRDGLFFDRPVFVEVERRPRMRALGNQRLTASAWHRAPTASVAARVGNLSHHGDRQLAGQPQPSAARTVPAAAHDAQRNDSSSQARQRSLAASSLRVWRGRAGRCAEWARSSAKYGGFEHSRRHGQPG
jgi:hypothetical protein